VAALQTAYKLDLTYREGFIKNRYIGRTFIMPGQAMRKKTVRRKFNAMSLEFAGKNVLIVDGMFKSQFFSYPDNVFQCETTSIG
jgi:amidophosphoribosyltransferase